MQSLKHQNQFIFSLPSTIRIRRKEQKRTQVVLTTGEKAFIEWPCHIAKLPFLAAIQGSRSLWAEGARVMINSIPTRGYRLCPTHYYVSSIPGFSNLPTALLQLHHFEMDARIMLTTHNRTLSTTTHEIVSPKWQCTSLTLFSSSTLPYFRSQESIENGSDLWQIESIYWEMTYILNWGVVNSKPL